MAAGVWDLLLMSMRENPPAVGVGGEAEGPLTSASVRWGRGSCACLGSPLWGTGGSVNASLCAGLCRGPYTPPGMWRAGWKASG